MKYYCETVPSVTMRNGRHAGHARDRDRRPAADVVDFFFGWSKKAGTVTEKCEARSEGKRKVNYRK